MIVSLSISTSTNVFLLGYGSPYLIVHSVTTQLISYYSLKNVDTLCPLSLYFLFLFFYYWPTRLAKLFLAFVICRNTPRALLHHSPFLPSYAFLALDLCLQVDPEVPDFQGVHPDHLFDQVVLSEEDHLFLFAQACHHQVDQVVLLLEVHPHHLV